MSVTNQTKEEFIYEFFIAKKWCSTNKPRDPAKCFVSGGLMYLYKGDRERIEKTYKIINGKWKEKKEKITFYVTMPLYKTTGTYWSNVEWNKVCQGWKKAEKWIPNFL